MRQNPGMLNLPPDQMEAQLRAQRNQRIAQLLSQQSQAPMEYDQRGAISPLAPLSKMVASLGGLYFQNKAEKDALESSKAAQAADMRAFGIGDGSATTATPRGALSMTDNNTNDYELYRRNPELYLKTLAESRAPTTDVKNYEQSGAGKDVLKNKQIAELLKSQGEAAKSGLMDVSGGNTVLNAQTGSTWTAPKIDGAGDLNKVVYQPISTADGIYNFDGRTGQMKQISGANGKPITKVDADADLARRKAEAEALGRGQAGLSIDAQNAEKKASQIATQIAAAKKLLPQATGSGVGATIDAVGRMIGATSESAQAAAQLETLSGWLTANVPRMEGPQSNADVENYKIMAARVGDRTVPVQERIKMLETLEQLQKKYSSINSGYMSSAPRTGEHTSKSGNKITFTVE